MTDKRNFKPASSYKHICEEVLNYPDDYFLSFKNVKEWEKHNKKIVKELKILVRDKKRKGEVGKEYNKIKYEIINRKGYLKNIKEYFENGIWRDLFYGEDMEHKISFECVAKSYDSEGYLNKSDRCKY